MIPKIVTCDSFDFGVPAAALIGVYSGGFDDRPLRKRASAIRSDLDFEKKANHSYIHLISLGAAETYGQNSNGDIFPGGDYSFTPPMNKSAGAIEVPGGLREYHDKTFMERGGVYRNHVNSHKGGKPSGYIVKAAYNEDMDRGELIIGVDNDIWSKDLEKLANDKPVFFSISADVPYDYCSVCGHQNEKFSDYCDHLKNDMGALTKSGHQVGAVNYRPMFHDISGVIKPADKIAFALRKVANDNRVLSGAELAALAGMAPRTDLIRSFSGLSKSSKESTLAKLAKMEKEILASAGGCGDLMLPFVGGEDREFPENIIAKLRNEDPGSVFGGLRGKLVVMPLETFLKFVSGPRFHEIEPDVPDIRAALPGVFERLAERGCPAVEDGSYEPAGLPLPPSIVAEIGKLVGSHSLADEPVKRRVTITVIRGPIGLSHGMPKKAASRSAVADFLAGEYAKYALSFADGLPDDKIRLTAAQTLANSIG